MARSNGDRNRASLMKPLKNGYPLIPLESGKMPLCDQCRWYVGRSGRARISGDSWIGRKERPFRQPPFSNSVEDDDGKDDLGSHYP